MNITFLARVHMCEFIYSVLTLWHTPVCLRAVAQLILDNLTRQSRDYCNTDLVDHHTLPAVLGGGTPASVAPTPIPVLLQQLAASEAPDAVCVRALFLVLFMFDGRIRRMVMMQHPWHELLGTVSPTETRAFFFCHRGTGMGTACERFVTDANNVDDPALILDTAREFVTMATTMWQNLSQKTRTT